MKDSLRVLEYGAIATILRGYAVTPIGRKKAEELRPLTDELAVRVELQRVAEARGLVEAKMLPALSEVNDLRPLLERIHEQGVALGADGLLEVASTLLRVNSIQSFFEAHGEAYPAHRELFRAQPDFTDLVHEIQEKIDARGQVRDYATPRLNKIRRGIVSLRETIRGRMQKILQSPEWSRHLQSTRASVRGDRLVVQVRADARGRVRGIVHDRSQTGATFYIEPQQIVEAQNELAELRVKETREVTQILWTLTRSLLDREVEVIGAVEVLGEYDLVQAKARYAVDFGMTAPAVQIDDRSLVLREARHPVLFHLEWKKAREEGLDPSDARKAAADRVIPFDVRLGEDFGRLVVTGPNTGGKTVTLKAIGLLCLMAQTGMQVPASEGARVPLYDRVLADIGDEQSIQQSLSTFSAHISKIANILELATPRSLVLLDELGAGTDPLEGGALGTSILEALDQGDVSAVITTHLGVLKEFAYSNPRAENASVDFDDESLEPTYRLLLGQPGSSNALLIARRLGLSQEICDRAARSLSTTDRTTEELISSMRQSRRELEERRTVIEALESKAREAQESIDQELRAVEERREHLTREAEHEIDRVLQDLRIRISRVSVQLRSAPKGVRGLADELDSALEAASSSSPLAQKRRDYANGLRKDDLVYLPQYKQKGRVRKIDRKQESLQVQIGSLSVTVPFAEVSWIEVDRS